jgi:UDP-glucose 4-epimerase
MRVLVTGGAGYIGSVTSEILLRAGHEVAVFDSLLSGHRAAVPGACRFIQGDLSDRNDVGKAFLEHRPEAVMHFAGHIQVGESMRNPLRYLGDNVISGLNLLKATVEHGVRKFILSSTANLFDRPEKIPIDETAAIVPGSPYGESKHFLERALYWLDRTHGLCSAALRYFNAAGATDERGEDHEPETHLIPLVLQVAQGRRDHIDVFGNDYDTPDGTCIRDYIHVSDLAAAHLLALQALDHGAHTFNLGNGSGFSVMEIIQSARQITGHPIPAVEAPRRPGDVARLVADSSKIRRELGWTPAIPDVDGIIKSAWRWMTRHPQGYGKSPSP